MVTSKGMATAAEALDRTENIRLSERVLEWITDQIVTGAIWPGQWISEHEIAATLGVSKAPVHEAVRSLARDRIVRVVPRRGTIVAETTAQDYEEIYLSKALVDGELVALAVPVLTDEEIRRLRQLASEMREAVGKHLAYYRCSHRFWETIRNACPNEVIADLSAQLWRRQLRYCGISMRLPGIEERSQSKVQQLVDAIAAKDVVRARSLTGEIFRENCGISEIKQVLPLTLPTSAGLSGLP